MGHRHSGLGHQVPEPPGYLVDVVDPVVDEKHLPLAQQLPADGLGHGPLVVLADEGQDGLPVGWWGVDQAQVPNTGQRHLESAGYRRSRQGEDVHVGPDCLDGLLVGDAEALFLVDDEESQVGKGHVTRNQPVGADHHVHRTVGQATHHPAGLLCAEEPAEDLDPNRVGSEAVPEGLAVLLGEQRCRYQHRRLAAVLDSLEHRPDGHLGLAEPDVTTDHPVHGCGPFHVGLDVFHSGDLVDRLLVREGLLHLPLPRGVIAEGPAGRGSPVAVQVNEFLGDLGHCRPDPRFGPLPVGASHAAQSGGLATAVGANRVDLLSGEVEPVVPPVFEQQVVAFHSGQGSGD